MSDNQKCLNLIRRGGGQQFSKMSEIQKSLKFPMGGGGQAYLGIFPKFFRFFFMMAPLRNLMFYCALEMFCPLVFNHNQNVN